MTIEQVKRFATTYDKFLIIGLAILLRAFGRGSSSYGVTGELYRDLNVLYNFLRLGHWPLLGPASSLGGFSFGALYYYLLAPFLWLFHFAPYGATFVSALFSVLAVWMLYELLLVWFENRQMAALGSLFMAVSVLDIQNAYYISNPNLMPFFILWFFYCLTFILRGRQEWKYYIGLGLAAGAATQLHATALLLLPLVGAFAIWKYWRQVNWWRLGVSAFCALLLYIPYIVYGFVGTGSNTKGIVHLGATNFGLLVKPASITAIGTFAQSWFVSRMAFFDFLSAHLFLGLVFSVLFIGALLTVFLKRKILLAATPKITEPGKFIFFLWLGLGLLMFLLFQYPIQPFYFFVLWPIPLILFAWLLSSIYINNKRFFYILLGLFLLMQTVQLFYFYGQVYQPVYSDKNLTQDFQRIKLGAQGESYNVVNEFADVNQFIYYKKIEGLDKTITKFEAAKLYVMCEAVMSQKCEIKQINYTEIGSWEMNKMRVVILQRNSNQ